MFAPRSLIRLHVLPVLCTPAEFESARILSAFCFFMIRARAVRDDGAVSTSVATSCELRRSGSEPNDALRIPGARLTSSEPNSSSIKSTGEIRLLSDGQLYVFLDQSPAEWKTLVAGATGPEPTIYCVAGRCASLGVCLVPVSKGHQAELAGTDRRNRTLLNFHKYSKIESFCVFPTT